MVVTINPTWLTRIKNAVLQQMRRPRAMSGLYVIASRGRAWGRERSGRSSAAAGLRTMTLTPRRSARYKPTSQSSLDDSSSSSSSRLCTEQSSRRCHRRPRYPSIHARPPKNADRRQSYTTDQSDKPRPIKSAAGLRPTCEDINS